jgi:hypothetical protein
LYLTGNTFYLRYKNRPVNAVYGNSWCMLKTSGNTQIHTLGGMQSFSFKWLGSERRWEGGFWMEIEAVGCEKEEWIELAQC